jgi:TonB family protein
MLSVFLKRVLPFALTLLVGVALGGFTSLFRAATGGELRSSSPTVVSERRYGCNKSFYNSRRFGRLVSIERLTESGEWVLTRPVTPEIYELTTRPAIIRSRPSAFFTDEARRGGVSGTVTVEATLAPEGRVTELSVYETDLGRHDEFGEELTAQAIAAARRLDFMPAIRNEEPVAQRIRLEYRFE